MKNDFDVMLEMVNASKDICMAPSSNVKRMNAGKGE